jgi:hypothetical protein
MPSRSRGKRVESEEDNAGKRERRKREMEEREGSAVAVSSGRERNKNKRGEGSACFFDDVERRLREAAHQQQPPSNVSLVRISSVASKFSSIRRLLILAGFCSLCALFPAPRPSSWSCARSSPRTDEIAPIHSSEKSRERNPTTKRKKKKQLTDAGLSQSKRVEDVARRVLVLVLDGRGRGAHDLGAAGRDEVERVLERERPGGLHRPARRASSSHRVFFSSSSSFFRNQKKSFSKIVR